MDGKNMKLIVRQRSADFYAYALVWSKMLPFLMIKACDGVVRKQTKPMILTITLM